MDRGSTRHGTCDDGSAAAARGAMCEINPSNFLSLYGVPNRQFFPYPRLMSATRPWVGTPRFDRAQLAFRRTCGPGAPACFSPPNQPVPTQSESTLTLPSVQQLGASSIATKGSRFSLAGHRSPHSGRRSRFHRDQSQITSHRFCKSIRMNVYKLPFCYPLYNEYLCHVGGGGGVQGV